MFISFLKFIVVTLFAACIAAGCYYGYYKLWIEPKELAAQQGTMQGGAIPADPSVRDFERVQEVRRSGNGAETQAALQRFINDYPQSPMIETAVDMLGEVNSAEFFSKTSPAGTTYIVRPGDTVTRVATQSKMPIELLMAVNGLPNTKLRIGQPLRVFPAQFTITVIQRTRRVALMRDGRFFRSYPAIEWPGKEKNSPPTTHPKQTGKVASKLAFQNGVGVRPDEPSYASADHQILLTGPPRAVYTHRMGADGKASPRPPGGGFGIAPEGMSEIALLVRVGTAVSLE
jgi:LysM repeat protein